MTGPVFGSRLCERKKKKKKKNPLGVSTSILVSAQINFCISNFSHIFLNFRSMHFIWRLHCYCLWEWTTIYLKFLPQLHHTRSPRIRDSLVSRSQIARSLHIANLRPHGSEVHVCSHFPQLPSGYCQQHGSM